MNKKTVVVIVCCLLFCLLLQLSACKDQSYIKSGIENFNPQDSSLELTQYLIPENFLQRYPYIKGDYEYCDLSTVYIHETAILYMTYDESTYVQAKEYALSNMNFVDQWTAEYQGYTFLSVNLAMYPDDDRRVFFGYSDATCTIISLGTNMDEANEYSYSDFSEYVSDYFSFFNWNETIIEREPASKNEQ